MTTQVPERLRRLLVNQLAVEYDAVTPTAHIAADLGADSLDLCDLVHQFEKEFHVALSESDETIFDEATVGDVVALLKARGAEV